MEKKIALFPGSFDPITKGHKSIVERALPMFDKIVVAVGTNTAKNSVFPLEKRIELLSKDGIDPDVVVINMGTNDLTHNISLTKFTTMTQNVK